MDYSKLSDGESASGWPISSSQNTAPPSIRMKTQVPICRGIGLTRYRTPVISHCVVPKSFTR